MLQPLRWYCVDCVIHHERDVREEQHHTYMWREQEIIEWSWHVNSIVACCHSAKLCAYAARDFRSQQYHYGWLCNSNALQREVLIAHIFAGYQLPRWMVLTYCYWHGHTLLIRIPTWLQVAGGCQGPVAANSLKQTPTKKLWNLRYTHDMVYFRSDNKVTHGNLCYNIQL